MQGFPRTLNWREEPPRHLFLLRKDLMCLAVSWECGWEVRPRNAANAATESDQGMERKEEMNADLMIVVLMQDEVSSGREV